MVAAVKSVPRELRARGSIFVRARAYLILEDGAVFEGTRIGAPVEAVGEVVFTTSMTGYQEVISDPSYRGQIVVMAAPLIGNYGFNPQAWEARGPHVRGFVVREACEVPSHYLSREPLDEFLAGHGIAGLTELDTRRLVRHLRIHGLKRGMISGSADQSTIDRVRDLPELHEQDLVGEASCKEPIVIPGDGPRIALLDCGVKLGIIDALRRRGCEVHVLPHTTGPEAIAAFEPGGVLLSNGPGDPAVLSSVVATVRDIIDNIPVMGVCLGHQLLALAVGGRTYKMKFGHRGSNQPVLDQLTGRVMITTQNHGYAVDPDTLPSSVEVTHVNLNDGTIEGLRHRHLPVFSVQFHPEGRPGPHDADHLYDEFLDAIGARTEVTHAEAR
ncbi:MAG: glutamine-hydrolyzing carbamoyl-phosphate synthase small subunit [bacterium]